MKLPVVLLYFCGYMHYNSRKRRCRNARYMGRDQRILLQGLDNIGKDFGGRLLYSSGNVERLFLAPVKKGISIGNNNANTHNHYDEEYWLDDEE